MNLGRVSSAALMMSGVSGVLAPRRERGWAARMPRSAGGRFSAAIQGRKRPSA